MLPYHYGEARDLAGKAKSLDAGSEIHFRVLWPTRRTWVAAEGPVFLKEKTHHLSIYGCIPQSPGWIAGTTLERQPVGPFPSPAQEAAARSYKGRGVEGGGIRLDLLRAIMCKAPQSVWL